VTRGARTLPVAGLTPALALSLSRAGTPSPQAPSSPARDKVCKLVNGRWFDGTAFKRRVLYVAGGVTASGGHPVRLYEEYFRKVKTPGPDGTFENLGYVIIDNDADLEKKWPMIMADAPDFYGVTALAEALNVHALNVLDNRALLKAWCETTAETIFPKRRIGHLQEGYEASFLVLGGDPLADFEKVKDIRMRFKQGRRIPGSVLGL
jgi:hypothetical protein